VAYNTIYTRRDRFLIHGVIFGAALLTHTGNIWTLACCHLDLTRCGLPRLSPTTMVSWLFFGQLGLV
jgi:hypothetical protein